MQGVLSFGGTPFCFPCKKILEGIRMKCTQCGTEFEGNFCPVCGTRAQTAESAGAGQSAGQGGAAPPQGAGQAAQAAGLPPQGAGQNLVAQADRQGEGAASSAVPSVTDAPPEKLPRPKKSLLVESKTWNDRNVFGSFALFFILIAVAMFCTLSSRYLLTADVVCLVCCLLAAAVVLIVPRWIVSRVYPCGTRRYTDFLMQLRKGKKKPIDRVDYRRENRLNTVMFLFIPVMFLLLQGMMLLLGTEMGRAAGIATLVFIVLSGAVCVTVYAVWWRRHRREILTAYYGKENPQKDAVPIVTYAQLGEELRVYQEEWDKYLLNGYARRCYKHGKAKGKGTGYLTFRTRVVPLILTIVEIALLVVIFFVGQGYMTNVFRADRVLAVQTGIDAVEVEQYLGEPYEKNEDAVQYVYYSDNYVTLLERNKNFDISSVQDWNDLENAFADAQALYTTEYAYIEVQFELTGSLSGSTNWWNTAMRSIFFDPSRTEQTRDDKKNVRERDVTVAEIEQGASAGTAVVTVHYDDGSIWRAEVSGTLAEGSADIVGETVTLSCYDPYAAGTEATFTVQATVVEAADEPVAV